jgi:hypothetical protein
VQAVVVVGLAMLVLVVLEVALVGIAEQALLVVGGRL